MLFAIQVTSVMGLPLERTTMVGIPVSRIAWIRGPWAPTRARESRSTCSPVLFGVG